MMAIRKLEFSSFTRGLSLHRLTKKDISTLQKTIRSRKIRGGYILKSGYAKKYAFQKFWGGGGGKGDLEKSRFDWVFLNEGVPY